MSNSGGDVHRGHEPQQDQIKICEYFCGGVVALRLVERAIGRVAGL